MLHLFSFTDILKLSNSNKSYLLAILGFPVSVSLVPNFVKIKIMKNLKKSAREKEN